MTFSFFDRYVFLYCIDLKKKFRKSSMEIKKEQSNQIKAQPGTKDFMCLTFHIKSVKVWKAQHKAQCQGGWRERRRLGTRFIRVQEKDRPPL